MGYSGLISKYVFKVNPEVMYKNLHEAYGENWLGLTILSKSNKKG